MGLNRTQQFTSRVELAGENYQIITFRGLLPGDILRGIRIKVGATDQGSIPLLTIRAVAFDRDEVNSGLLQDLPAGFEDAVRLIPDDVIVQAEGTQVTTTPTYQWDLTVDLSCYHAVDQTGRYVVVAIYHGGGAGENGMGYCAIDVVRS